MSFKLKLSKYKQNLSANLQKSNLIILETNVNIFRR